jgi:hypothetical protein
MYAIYDPEAFDVEYEEMQDLRKLSFLDMIEQEIDAERRKKSPKWARLARKYVTALREMFWHGSEEIKEKAQYLLNELEMESTVPLNDLDAAFAYTGEDDNVIYEDVDSYVGLSDNPIFFTQQDQWEKDYIEVQREVETITEADPMGAIDPETFELLHKIESHDDLLSIPPQVIITESKETSLKAAYEAIGADEATIQQAIDANFESPQEWDTDEDIWFVDGGITSEPIKQNEEQELRPTKDLPYLRELAKPYIDALKEELRFLTWKYQEMQREYVDFLAMISTHPKGQAEQFARDAASLKDNPMIHEFMLDVQFNKKTFRGSAWWRLDKMKDENPHDGVESFAFSPLKGRLSAPASWGRRVKAGIAESRQKQNLIDWMNRIHDQFEPQDLAVIFLSVQNGFLLAEEDATQIKTVGYDSLAHFLDLWGDEVIENIIDPPMDITPLGDDRISDIARAIENEIIEKQFVPTAKNIELTQAYARGWFNALGAGESDLRNAGFANWRFETSPGGAAAFDWAYEHTEGDWQAKTKAAWRAFYKAGTVKKVNAKGILIHSTDGTEQWADWGLATWKLRRKEIYLDKIAKARLRAILRVKKWGPALLKELKK